VRGVRAAVNFFYTQFFSAVVFAAEMYKTAVVLCSAAVVHSVNSLYT
jgi:hypothetical protein